MNTAHRHFRHALQWAAGVLLCQSLLAGAQTYPSKNLTLIVPFPPGGITDATARLAARKLGEELKQAVVVENKAGAGGSVGTGTAAKAAADGHTLLLGTLANMVVNAHVYKEALPYQPQRDFTAVQGLMSVPVVVVGRANLPFNSLKGAVEAALSKPKSYSYGSPGAGTVAHLAAEQFQLATRTSLLHVPYKGSAPAITDLLGGTIDLAFDYASTTAAHIQAGKLVPLAVTSPQRLSGLPQVPTMAELGFPKAEVTSWLGLFVPQGTPAPAIERLRQAFEKIMQQADFLESVDKLGGQPMPMGPQAFKAFVSSEYLRWKDVVQSAGIQPN